MHTMKCTKCGGSGEIKSPPAVASTITGLKRGRNTAELLSAFLQIKFTAACERLDRLVDYGLATKSRLSRRKPWEYILK